MVIRPSWQAQLSGKKVWTLVPPPECEHVCSTLNVTVHKGDISKLGLCILRALGEVRGVGEGSNTAVR